MLFLFRVLIEMLVVRRQGRAYAVNRKKLRLGERWLD